MNTPEQQTAIHQTERMRNLLAFFLVGSFIGVIPVFVFFTIPTANKDIITYMVGQLSGMALTALGFYFVNKVGQDALDAKRADNTGKLADLVAATAVGTGVNSDAGKAAGAVADAAVSRAEEIQENKP
jgi:hypothetical protein